MPKLGGMRGRVELVSSVKTCVIPYSSSCVGEEGSVILGLVRPCKRGESIGSGREYGLRDVETGDCGDLCDGGGFEDLHIEILL
jgi:hypothetical protein